MTAMSTTTFAPTSDLTIDHFHARYEGLDRVTSDRLDRVMSTMLEPALRRALADHRLDELYAICIPSMDIAIDIEADLSLPAVARQWADRLAAEVAEVVETCRGASSPSAIGAVAVGPSDSGDVFVVYRRAVDALLDLVTSVATGDRTRLWAWNQIGLWPRSSQPSADDVALIVARHPSLAGAVVRVAGEQGPLRWTSRGWHSVAAAVVAAFRADTAVGLAAGSFDQRGTSSFGEPDAGSGRGLAAGSSEPDSEPPEPSPMPDHHRLAALIPPSIWRHASPAERYALAVLALAVGSPSQARDPRAVAAVAAAAVTSSPTRTESRAWSTTDPQPDAAPTTPTTVNASETLYGSTEARPAHGADDHPPIRTIESGLERTLSDYGGVLFLIHPLRELDVVDELGGTDPGLALAELVSLITGVAIDDPVVGVISGGGGEASGNAVIDPSIDRELLEDQADRVRSWLTQRVSIDADQPEDGDPFGWIWSRRTVIDHTPGWIEATMALDSVDVRVRSAALDLDPGFVWWLGSVVRFRYA